MGFGGGCDKSKRGAIHRSARVFRFDRSECGSRRVRTRVLLLGGESPGAGGAAGDGGGVGRVVLDRGGYGVVVDVIFFRVVRECVAGVDGRDVEGAVRAEYEAGAASFIAVVVDAGEVNAFPIFHAVVEVEEPAGVGFVLGAVVVGVAGVLPEGEADALIVNGEVVVVVVAHEDGGGAAERFGDGEDLFLLRDVAVF